MARLRREVIVEGDERFARAVYREVAGRLRLTEDGVVDSRPGWLPDWWAHPGWSPGEWLALIGEHDPDAVERVRRKIEARRR